MARSIPFLGGVIAIATIGAAIRQKGVLGGAVDTALNSLPFVGAAKLAVESVRGRDLIHDRRALSLETNRRATVRARS
jgi:hypothetical protein